MNHSMNITHDGTLKIGVPKGFRVEKVIVEELGTVRSRVAASYGPRIRPD